MVLKPLWRGIRQHRGKGLAAFLKAIGYIIPLMDAEYANYYTREVMVILIREFQSPDEEMKKIVLKVRARRPLCPLGPRVKVPTTHPFPPRLLSFGHAVPPFQVVKQCSATDGVEPQYIRETILPDFFKAFWVRRMALDRRNYKQLVETTVELANKVCFPSHPPLKAPPLPSFSCPRSPF